MTPKRQRIRKRMEKAERKRLSTLPVVPLFEESPAEVDLVEETPPEVEVKEPVKYVSKRTYRDRKVKLGTPSKTTSRRSKKDKESEKEVI